MSIHTLRPAIRKYYSALKNVVIYSQNVKVQISYEMFVVHIPTT